jgi:phosphate transport system substrate-binding protein
LAFARLLTKPAFLALAGGLALVSACGGTGNGTAGNSTPSPTATAVSIKVGNPTKAVTVSESGSSLMLPYLQKMVDPIHTTYSNVTLTPAAGGSGKGISDAIAGTVLMGGSDAYLSDAQAQQNATILNIPIAISAQSVDYNVPGVSNLKLSGDVIAKIYMGKITKWNDPAIASLNSGASLPGTTIIPVRRVDSSGDTFIFTSFLTATNTDWSNGPNIGTTVTWPAVPGEVTASGNPGMVQVCQQTPGCIAYIGVSVRSTAKSAGLGESMLQNKAGSFVTPETANITAAVAAKAPATPDDLRASLIYADGKDSYPIVNYEYLMIKSNQADADTALALRSFLAYAIDPAMGASSTNLSAVNFVSLPDSVVPKVKTAIAKIQP